MGTGRELTSLRGDKKSVGTEKREGRFTFLPELRTRRNPLREKVRGKKKDRQTKSDFCTSVGENIWRTEQRGKRTMNKKKRRKKKRLYSHQAKAIGRLRKRNRSSLRKCTAILRGRKRLIRGKGEKGKTSTTSEVQGGSTRAGRKREGRMNRGEKSGGKFFRTRGEGKALTVELQQRHSERDNGNYPSAEPGKVGKSKNQLSAPKGKGKKRVAFLRDTGAAS